MISIITICKNSEKTIRATLDSVMQQTFTDWQLIVKDGESLDSTVAIVESYSDSRVKLIKQPDAGISDAFNQAVKACDRDFVIFLNSDDQFAAPDALARFINEIEEQGGLDAERGVYYGRSVVANHPLGLASFGLPKTKLEMRDYYRWPYQHQAMLIARKELLRVGDFDLNLRYTMDYDWLLRLTERVLPKFIDVELVNVDGRGVSNRLRWRTHWERFRVLRRRKGNFVALPWIGYFIAGELVLGFRQRFKSKK